MSRRQVMILIVGVVLAHLALFWIVADASPLPKTNFIPPPNFMARQASWVDEKTGEHLTYHEYQVRTKLALPDALMGRKE